VKNHLILFVCGHFDEYGGRPSGYMARLAAEIRAPIEVHNGGSLEDLQRLIDTVGRYRAIWWMPDIDNSVPKFAGSLKEKAPTSVLVISKNNRDGKYAPIDLVGRMLKAHAHLMLAIQSGPPFGATILDPLGNAFVDDEQDIAKVAQALVARTEELGRFTRVGSTQVGPNVPIPTDPEVDVFVGIVRGYAETFHNLVHAANPSRFLGNASYRCTRGGFPAFRTDDLLFMSRRNIDKRQIAADGFVAIRAENTPLIEYFGEAKPSVDAPIQRELFRIYPQARFMLHSHTYIDGAPFTSHRVPCGALEEVSQIVGAVGEWAAGRPLLVNLRGHGCLAIARAAHQLQDLPFIGRPLPEVVA